LRNLIRTKNLRQ